MNPGQRARLNKEKHPETGRKRIPPAIRFWRYVNKTEGCWLWTGGTMRGGYGQFGAFGTRPIAAHRFSYFLANGPIPEGLLVCHTCDNPPCVNPAHLFLGTYTDNIRDMVAKGRHARCSTTKTHCKRGHEFTPENTRIVRHSPPREQYAYKQCATCTRMHGRAADAKRRPSKRQRGVAS